MASPCLQGHNEPAKMRIQFGCASGQIDGPALRRVDRLEYALHDRPFHHFRAVGGAFKVAMKALLVAFKAEIDLKGFYRFTY